MFQIGLVVLCAVFVIGYIFFTAAVEREDAPAAGAEQAAPAADTDAA